jgi:hypothetical protein
MSVTYGFFCNMFRLRDNHHQANAERTLDAAKVCRKYVQRWPGVGCFTVETCGNKTLYN